MSQTPAEKELLEFFLKEHVPEYLNFVQDCWENPLLQDELRRQNYSAVITLLEKIRESKIELEKPFLYEEQIKQYVKNPWGD